MTIGNDFYLHENNNAYWHTETICREILGWHIIDIMEDFYGKDDTEMFRIHFRRSYLSASQINVSLKTILENASIIFPEAKIEYFDDNWHINVSSKDCDIAKLSMLTWYLRDGIEVSEDLIVLYGHLLDDVNSRKREYFREFVSSDKIVMAFAINLFLQGYNLSNKHKLSFGRNGDVKSDGIITRVAYEIFSDNLSFRKGFDSWLESNVKSYSPDGVYTNPKDLVQQPYTNITYKNFISSNDIEEW